MAESEKPNNSSGLPQLSVEKRMLLAFALVGLVLVLSQFLLGPQAPSKSGPTQKQPATAQQAKPPAEAPPVANAATQAAEAASGAVAAQQEQTQTLETNVYRIVFNNRGGVVRSWQLKTYRDSTGKPLELVNAGSA